MVRLLKPYIIWPLITFCFYNAVSFFINGKMLYGFDALGFQFLMGHSPIEAVMYFNWDMMVITIIFTGVFVLFSRRKAAVILVCMSVGAVSLVYSGLNYDIYVNLPYEMRYPLGRIAELFPAAGIGIALFHINFETIKKKLERFGNLLYFVILFETGWLMFSAYRMEENFQWNHFGYGRPWQILIAVCLVILCYYISDSGIMKPVVKVFTWIAGYSQGIYGVHYITGTACEKAAACLWPQMSQSVFLCIVIYAVSCLLSAGISKLPWKWCREITR